MLEGDHEFRIEDCRADAVGLAQRGESGQAGEREWQAGDVGTDGIVASQDTECACEDRSENLKKATALFFIF
jgi:hypothetical protein